MLRNVRQRNEKKPVLLMLHGAGSSAAIFGIQTHSLAVELSKHFDLVFLDAPTPSAPGPGVLPLFADMPAYYRWITPGEVILSPMARLAEILDLVRHLQAQLDQQSIRPEHVVGILGFSQGALVALALLGLRLAGQSSWENLRFCVAIGASTTGNAAQLDSIETMTTTLSTFLGREDGKFPGHSVQAAGVKDLWYRDARRIANMCAKETTQTMDYRDGHVVPRRRTDVLKLVQMIMDINEVSKNAPKSKGAAWPSITGPKPFIFARSDIGAELPMMLQDEINARTENSYTPGT
ncbi:serine hydrolase-domain-containing protein [Biscogniauxia sp. FL1348]|nr:serine hydrolase-domain-containing protein [Biscogniauxia sp. FL1348]